MTFDKEKILEDLRQRRQLFDTYILKNHMNKVTCPSCGYPTLDERAVYNICCICKWEDNGQDDPKADEVWGGPNYKLSLTASRLEIGNELLQLANVSNGELVTNPETFLKILDSHSKRMQNVRDRMTGDENIKHPLWDEYRKTESLIKAELVEKTKL